MPDTDFQVNEKYNKSSYGKEKEGRSEVLVTESNADKGDVLLQKIECKKQQESKW
ncbi:MAG: hypothetical protein OEY64_10955 [Nitrospinota bacterium]|nr:hypothetical protein [Nitrospinota bacterium]